MDRAVGRVLGQETGTSAAAARIPPLLLILPSTGPIQVTGTACAFVQLPPVNVVLCGEEAAACCCVATTTVYITMVVSCGGQRHFVEKTTVPMLRHD